MSNLYSPDDFAAWLIEHLAHSTDTSTVDLIPAPCGVGKSYSMTVQIAEALNGTGKGIILVTDEVERLESYVQTDPDQSNLGEYIQRNIEKILVYKAANAKAEMRNLFRKPIILMTTQRFFSLRREDVIALVDTHIPKRHIFIDERALLSEVVRVDIGTFNDLDTKLKECLDNTVTEKDFLITQFRNLRERYDRIMADYEKSHTDNELKLWHTDSDEHATINDEKFLHLIFETHAAKLRKSDNDILKKCRAIFQIVNGGALFISRRKPESRSKQEYSNFFLVVLDHSDLLLNFGAKTVILDGTGDLDPMYKAGYVNHIDCSQFKRDLSNLTINIVNVNTSRNAIARAPATNQRVTALIEYVKSLPKVDAVFTYGYGKSYAIHSQNTVEHEFAKAGFLTGHLGGLKGTNRFRELTDIVQVGLNRIPDEYYLAMALQGIFAKLPSDKEYYGLMDVSVPAKQTMLNCVLADLEQNIFRGVIRNPESTQKETYTIIYDNDPRQNNPLPELTEMIVERYSSLGATVNVMDTPRIFLDLKTEQRKTKDGRKTAAQKVKEYLDAVEPGKPFKRSKLLSDCGLSETTYKAMLNKNKHIKERLDAMKGDVHGWFMKPNAPDMISA